MSAQNGRADLAQPKPSPVSISYDLQLEAHLLGAMITSPKALVSVVDKLKPTDFFGESHRIIFQAITNLYNNNDGVDGALVRDELRKMGQLDYIGGMMTVRRVIENVPSVANASSYAKHVREMSAKRELLDFADRLQADASNGTLKADDVLACAQERIAEIRAPVAAVGGAESGRVLLGHSIKEGIEPPEEQEPHVLLRGKVHSIYAAPGTGKTFLALYMVVRGIEREERVLYLDAENGPRIVSERLADLGVDAAKVDEYLHYHPYSSLTLAAEHKRHYEALLDTVQPDLLIFDSWLNFLAASGLDENSSNDVAQWSTAYARPARERGITVVILDHVPHEGDHSRGSTRKKDEVDVMWRLRRSQPFDRDTVGEMTLYREKDREGWLPSSVVFSVGGTPDGFIFARSSGTVEERQQPSELLRTERAALDALRECGPEGASNVQWLKAAEKEPHGVSRATYYRARKELKNRGYVRSEDGIYHTASGTQPPESPAKERGSKRFVGEDGVSSPFETVSGDGSLKESNEVKNTENSIPTPKTDGSLKKSQGGLTGEMRPDDPLVSQVSPPLKGEPVRLGRETAADAERVSDLQERIRGRRDKLRREREEEEE